MAITWVTRPTQATNVVGHSFTSGSPNDTYGNTRWWTAFDTNGVSSTVNINGTSADASGTRTETVPSGGGPTPGG